MLRKRARSIQKDQEMGEVTSDGGSETYLNTEISGQRQKTNSFFNVPALFVGLSPKSVADCDSVRSPTSPLDFKLFSNMSTSLMRFPKPSQHRCWVCSKIGLGSIVDSLDDDDDDDMKTISSSNSKNILFGSQVRNKHPHLCEAPNSLPKNYPIFAHAKMRPSNLPKGSSDVLFEIGGDPLESDQCEKIQSFSLDSKRPGSEIYRLRACNNVLKTSTCLKKCSNGDENKLSLNDAMPVECGNALARSLTLREIELSEDYTCVISHGPNPKTIHIFGDCVLECHPNGVDSRNKIGGSESSGIPCLDKCVEITSSPSPYPSNDFLSCCDLCKKKLEDGKDIYMYRGEKAFCSWDCRLEEILFEEGREKSAGESPTKSTPKFQNCDQSFENNIFVAL